MAKTEINELLKSLSNMRRSVLHLMDVGVFEKHCCFEVNGDFFELHYDLVQFSNKRLQEKWEHLLSLFSKFSDRNEDILPVRRFVCLVPKEVYLDL